MKPLRQNNPGLKFGQSPRVYRQENQKPKNKDAQTQTQTERFTGSTNDPYNVSVYTVDFPIVPI